MRLIVATPVAVVEDTDDVVHLRAEDETGAFGILPGHARFVTTLPISVVSWRDAAGGEHHVAVRGGVLIVGDDDAVEIATRQAIREDDLDALERKLEEVFLREMTDDEKARTAARRLHLATMRRIQRVLDASRGGETMARSLGPVEDAER
jgi:F-type H+-transporting ATPase subunit epsilon